MLMFGDQKVEALHDVASPVRVRPGCVLRELRCRSPRPSRGSTERRRWRASPIGSGKTVAVPACDAVQRFTPPVVGGNLQPRNRARLVHQLRRLLFQSHSRDQVVDPRSDGLGWISGRTGTAGGSPFCARETQPRIKGTRTARTRNTRRLSNMEVLAP